MGFKAVINFIAGDSWSAVAEKVAKSTSKVQKGIKKAGDQARKASKKFKALGDSMKKVGIKALGFAAGIAGVAFAALKKSADIETMKIAFQTLTKDVELGNQAMKAVIDFTARTPFKLEGVANVATGLLAVGFSSDELTTKLGILADISAGVSKPMGDVAQAYLKAKSTGKLNMEILNMFLEKNINLWPALERTTGKTKEQLRELSRAGKLGFEDLDKAMASMTAEGGIFYKMTEKQSLTFNGLMSTLGDNFNFALAAIGDTLEELFGFKTMISDLIVKVGAFAKAFPDWARQNQHIIRMVAKFTIGLAIFGTVITVLGIMAGTVSILMLAFAGLTTVLGVLAAIAGFVFSPIGIAIAAVILLVVKLYQHFEGFRNLVDGIFESIANLASSMAGGMGEWIMGKLGLNMDGMSLGSLDTTNANTLDANIRVEAPPGTVKEVSTKGDGNTNLDVGEYLPEPA